jgi:hypothetical protein
VLDSAGAAALDPALGRAVLCALRAAPDHVV